MHRMQKLKYLFLFDCHVGVVTPLLVTLRSNKMDVLPIEMRHRVYDYCTFRKLLLISQETHNYVHETLRTCRHVTGLSEATKFDLQKYRHMYSLCPHIFPVIFTGMFLQDIANIACATGDVTLFVRVQKKISTAIERIDRIKLDNHSHEGTLMDSLNDLRQLVDKLSDEGVAFREIVIEFEDIDMMCHLISNPLYKNVITAIDWRKSKISRSSIDFLRKVYYFCKFCHPTMHRKNILNIDKYVKTSPYTNEVPEEFLREVQLDVKNIHEVDARIYTNANRRPSPGKYGVIRKTLMGKRIDN
jgi:hypothetical protein